MKSSFFIDARLLNFIRSRFRCNCCRSASWSSSRREIGLFARLAVSFRPQSTSKHLHFIFGASWHSRAACAAIAAHKTRFYWAVGNKRRAPAGDRPFSFAAPPVCRSCFMKTAQKENEIERTKDFVFLVVAKSVINQSARAMLKQTEIAASKLCPKIVRCFCILASKRL